MRNLLYYLHDPDGIVDSYIPHLLHAIKPYVDRLVVLCHGTLTPDGRKLLEAEADAIAIREARFSRKKATFSVIQDESLAGDELIIMECTVMGPVAALEPFFKALDDTDADVVTLMNYEFFVALRTSVLGSPHFASYWQDESAVSMAAYFSDNGFRVAKLIDASECKAVTDDPLMILPVEMARDKRCPFFPRILFWTDYTQVLQKTAGQPVFEFYRYLRGETTFNLNLLWAYLLRTQHQFDLYLNLHLMYVADLRRAARETPPPGRVALMMHLYYEDQLEQALFYAMNMPADADVYITTNSEAKKEKIEEVFGKLQASRIEVRVIENRGRDVSALLVGVRDVVSRYDYVCFMHDKKVLQIKSSVIGEGFFARVWENMLGSRTAVQNILAIFADNPRLGMLAPPPPNHADYFFTLATDWGPNYEVTRALANKLGYKGPMSPDKMPIAPLGTCFWFRPKALESLFQKEWRYTDFPPEPNNTDGTVLHAMERYYAFAVQRDGYYPAYVLNDAHASAEYANLKHYVRGYNRVEIEHGFTNYYDEMLKMQRHKVAELPVLREILRQLQTQIAEKELILNSKGTARLAHSFKTRLRTRMPRVYRMAVAAKRKLGR